MEWAMTDKVSTMDVRARIGDMLNRVALRHDEFIIERKGKALAALVPVERLEQMRRFARRHALDFMAHSPDTTLRFSALTGVRSMNEVFPLERAAEAYERMMSGKARFRVV